MAERMVFLDVETTGLYLSEGHRIIEIAAVEVVDRKVGTELHCRLNPEREIDKKASEIHGIILEDLAGEKKFPEVAEEVLDFIKDSELITHNVPFDKGFLDMELKKANHPRRVDDVVDKITDTLLMARKKRPGQRNSLNALCAEYKVDTTKRKKHGALIDAHLLIEVYLRMTGGQVGFDLNDERPATAEEASVQAQPELRKAGKPGNLMIHRANEDELAEHEAVLDLLDKGLEKGPCQWRKPLK